MSKQDHMSFRAESIISTYECDNVIVKKSDTVGKPRMGLGSTANENIALRRNYREMEQLWKKQKILGEEREWIIKLIDLYSKSVQVNYKRLTKRVGRIKSHLTDEEIKEMENDLQKKEFADKYRRLLRNEPVERQENKNDTTSANQTDSESSKPKITTKLGDVCNLGAIKEEDCVFDDASICDENQVVETKPQENLNKKQTSTKRFSVSSVRSHTSQCNRRSSKSSTSSFKRRPETVPNPSGDNNGFDESSFAMNEIIPSLEDLLDQLHNIKPQQFYENQRKLKLYDIQLLGEELETRKSDLFRAVDGIINWDKKETKEEEEERKRKEEEEKKPIKRKTSFMRSVLRNFSMELMMKTVQYGWTDIGQCRYLRNRGGDDDTDPGGVNTLAKDTMKISMDGPPEPPPDAARGPPRDPGFDENGKMIRTADLLGLKSTDDD